MVGAISGYSPYYYSYAQSVRGPSQNRGQAAERAAQSQTAHGASAAVTTAHRAANTGVPVQPVPAVTPVSPDDASTASLGIPLRQGADPVEMSVRMRIQYMEQPAPLIGGQSAQRAAADPAAALQRALGLTGPAPDPAAGEDELGAKAIQEAMDKGECQTCAERKYQDGSDDPGVSFKTAAHIDPDAAASVVRGHEQEHVVREQAKADREGRKVISQSVTLHNDICPECGRTYISGGTTRTVTASKPEPQQPTQEEAANQPFSAVA